MGKRQSIAGIYLSKKTEKDNILERYMHKNHNNGSLGKVQTETQWLVVIQY